MYVEMYFDSTGAANVLIDKYWEIRAAVQFYSDEYDLKDSFWVERTITESLVKGKYFFEVPAWMEYLVISFYPEFEWKIKVKES